jgi:hypothetical protein
LGFSTVKPAGSCVMYGPPPNCKRNKLGRYGYVNNPDSRPAASFVPVIISELPGPQVPSQLPKQNRYPPVDRHCGKDSAFMLAGSCKISPSVPEAFTMTTQDRSPRPLDEVTHLAACHRLRPSCCSCRCQRVAAPARNWHTYLPQEQPFVGSNLTGPTRIPLFFDNSTESGPDGKALVC